MKKQTDKKESVKISTALVDKVRLSKLKTGVNIGHFIETAITEKLNKDK